MIKNFKSIPVNVSLIIKEAPFWVGVLIVYCIATYSCWRIYDLYQTYSLQQSNNAQLKSQLDLLQSSKGLDDQEVSMFNKVASSLIPDEENYFDLIDALERLSQATGFQLYNYSINLAASTTDKLSISVAGRGSSESFFRFLQVYKYASGRLITIESLNFSPNSVQEYTFVLNFYHKKIALKPVDTTQTLLPTFEVASQIIGSAPQLSPEDVTFVKDILQQTK